MKSQKVCVPDATMIFIITEVLIECGIDDAEQLLYDVETELYCPIEKEGKLFCPNCGKEVERGRVTCLEESCEIVFVWR